MTIIKEGKKVFSYCIYGNKKKYCQGLLENIQIIVKEFPNFEIWIHKGTDVPDSYIEQYKSYSAVRIFETSQNGASLMCNRFFSIDHPECELIIVRDADSRVHFRDQWCIREFLASDKSFHVIRDHYWHKTKITGGTWAMRKGAISLKIEDLYNSWIQRHVAIKDTYDTDQKFIEQCLYPLIKDSLLVHSDIVGFEGEVITPILAENNNLDFVGNVIDYDASGLAFHEFTYNKYPFVNHILWLYNQKQWRLIHKLTTGVNIFSVPEYTQYNRTLLLTIDFFSAMQLSNIERAKNILSLFRYSRVNDNIIQLSNLLLEHYKKESKKIIGTTDLTYNPQDDEIVIYYGAFMHDIKCLPIGNKLYRHPIYFKDIKHDVVHYDTRWEPIEYIYLLNLEERVDRYYELLCELCRMRAPLDRVYHYKAQKQPVTGNKQVDAYLGATKNHLDVVQHFIENPVMREQKGGEFCLVLEDDVVFTPDVDRHLEDLKKFCSRNYAFDICFTSCSKCHEYRDHDDLLMVSYQECTTTSGYILNRRSAHRVLGCYQEGYSKMKETLDYHKYVCDRYWDPIRDDGRMFFFRDKFGFQRPSWSSIDSTYKFDFD